VLPTLSADTLVRVAAIVNALHALAAPYSSLKTRLLEVYLPDVWEQTTQLLHYRELGDMQPSQLMDEMLAILPQEEVLGLLFKTIFLNRLPADIRAQVQGAMRLQDCRELVAAADVIWCARNQKAPVTLAAVPQEHVDELTDTVGAMKIQPGGAATAVAAANLAGAAVRGEPTTASARQPNPTRGRPTCALTLINTACGPKVPTFFQSAFLH